jgi:hypothetical protein
MFSAPKRWILILGLSTISCLLILPGGLKAQAPFSNPVVMVQIQCNPGTADQWREAFEKQEVPVIREVVRKGDVFTNFTYFEAPIPAQDVDFILLFELKTFASLDVRRIPPHWEELLHRLGPEGFAAYEKEVGSYEKVVRVSLLRSYRVQ